MFSLIFSLLCFSLYSGNSLLLHSPRHSVYDIIANVPQLTILRKLIDQTGLKHPLQKEAGPFTVFAPDNNAIAHLSYALRKELSHDKPLVRSILLYHISNSFQATHHLCKRDLLNTLSHDRLLKISNHYCKSIYIQDTRHNIAKLYVSNVKAKNGIIHIINRVLLYDPYAKKPNVWDSIRARPQLSLLANTMHLLGFDSLLKSDKVKVTVFAPTNAAKEKVKKSSLSMVNTLSYHILKFEIKSKDMKDGMVLKALNDQKIRVIKKSINAIVLQDANKGKSRVERRDVEASNGVIHIVDQVLIPKKTSIAHIVRLSPKHVLLHEALVLTGFDKILDVASKKKEMVTLWAPNDKAFKSVLTRFKIKTKEELEKFLKPILKYHLVGRRLKVADIPFGGSTMVTMLQGTVGTLFKSGTHGVKIKDSSLGVSKVVVPNEFANNGIVHMVDRVLIPNMPRGVFIGQKKKKL